MWKAVLANDSSIRAAFPGPGLSTAKLGFRNLGLDFSTWSQRRMVWAVSKASIPGPLGWNMQINLSRCFKPGG